MPTKNRRVATYLPQEINDRLSAFKADRGIEGDSQALITILAEFLGVAQQVAYSVDHSSTFATKDELAELNLKITHLAEQIQGFDRRLDEVIGKAASELKNEFLSELPQQEAEVAEVSPGQLELLSDRAGDQDVEALKQPVEPSSEPLSGSQDEWMTTKEAFEVLKPDCAYRTFRSKSPEDLHQRYGLHTDIQRKEGKKYNAKWLKLPAATDLPQALIESELPSESDSVTPDF
jgi:hypothetical protein